MAKTTTYGPSYYQRGSIQVWDFIRDQRLNFHLGNAIKYICRYGHKVDYNSQLSDLTKAIHYLENERDHLQATRNSEDLPKHDNPDKAFSSSGGISWRLSDQELGIPASACQAAEPYSGGVQGILGGGGDVISFASK